jgi:hypothetical protein
VQDGETALHRAVKTQDGGTAYELVELLVKEGKANVNCVTKVSLMLASDPMLTFAGRE